MSEQDVTILIGRYLEAVARLSKQVMEMYQIENLFSARQAKKIPRFGPVGDDGEFQFHGVGCTIDDGTTCANFDFFGQGRSDGFDAWRLHTFAEDNDVAADLNLDTSRDALKREIEDLVESGHVVPVAGSNLFTLASAG